LPLWDLDSLSSRFSLLALRLAGEYPKDLFLYLRGRLSLSTSSLLELGLYLGLPGF
jgi:hypothetical protein